MDTPARFERALVGSKPTALSPLSYGAVTEAVGVEPTSGVRRYALATRCRAGWRRLRKAEGEGVEPPRPEDPPVFETGYRAHGSPSAIAPLAGRLPAGGAGLRWPRGARDAIEMVAPAGVEPARPRVRAGSSTD